MSSQRNGMQSLVFRLVALLSVVSALSALSIIDAARAQSTPADPVTARTTVIEPTTRDAVRDLLSELNDTQVRALLLERLTREVERRDVERTAPQRQGFGESVRDHAQALGTYVRDAINKLSRIPQGVATAWKGFVAERSGDRGHIWFFISLAACLMVGGGAALVGHTAALHLDQKIIRRDGLQLELETAALNAAARLLPVAAFTVGAGVTNLLVNGAFPVDYDVIGRIIKAFAWTGVAVATARIALSPTLPEWRSCPIASGATDFLVLRIGFAAALFNFGVGFAEWLDRFGSPFSETRVGFWINLAFHSLLIVTIWQARRGISGIVAGSVQIAESGRAPWSARWPWLLILLFAGHWVLVNVLVATNSMPESLLTAMAVTLTLLTGLPIIDHALRAGVRRALPTSSGASVTLQAAEHATRSGLVRIARVAVAVVLALGLLWLWGLDLVALAHKGMGARFAGSVINVLLIAGLAYGLWELVRIVSDRQIVMERAALGLDRQTDSQQLSEGEGGGAGARLGTILPLVRIALQIAIAILATLAILGELGINVLPILAGAGVVGLAIGFGAQTLVKDVISGIFFLVDDAFRKGEYIDIGPVKGTVEKISLRSMQLRHHNGPLHTIPFGDIRHVTNFSRDWVTMKLSLRLTYDTDAEKVRKLIKKLGQEMAEDPELKPLFLQPLKSQGVVEMQDSAQIMRVKFMTRPGDQWGLRRIVFARIRELFEREGIRFASREVVVRVEQPSGSHDLTPEDRAAIGASAALMLEAAEGVSENDRNKG